MTEFRQALTSKSLIHRKIMKHISTVEFLQNMKRTLHFLDYLQDYLFTRLLHNNISNLTPLHRSVLTLRAMCHFVTGKKLHSERAGHRFFLIIVYHY